MAQAQLPDLADFDMGGDVWERQPGESTRDYSLFRLYRDMPAMQRSLGKVMEECGLHRRRVTQLSSRWSWRERADAWDDALHKVEDQERLEAIRAMHSTHRKAGRAAMMKAAQALSMLRAEDMSASEVVRLMALGAKLERDTLIVSVEELQGFEPIDESADDPWERIARELDPHTEVGDG